MSASAVSPAFEGARLRRYGNELVSLLAVLLRNTCFHPPENEVFEAPIARLRDLAGEVIEEEGRLKIETRAGDLFFNDRRLRPQFRSLRVFAEVERVLRTHAIGGLAILRVPEHATVSTLLALLVGPPRAAEDPVVGFNEALDTRGAREVQAIAPREIGGSEAAGRQERALRAYQEAFHLIRDYMANAHSPEELSARKAKRIVHQLVDLSFEEGGGFSLAGLAAIRCHDDYTFNHMVNVSVLAIAFGQRMGLRKSRLAQLGLCALYHDVGKLHVPAEVINRRERLTDEEWVRMGNHTVYAARTLFPTIARDLDVIPRILTALQHHRRMDGKGYPALRLLARQSFFTRVTAIVDSYDAMTTVRCYQNARLPHEAMRELWLHAGTMYDRALVKAFINCMGVFPVGSVVQLASGEVAVVCESNPHPDRLQQPVVRIAIRAGQRLADPLLLDLADPAAADRQVVRCVDPDAIALDPLAYTMAVSEC